MYNSVKLHTEAIIMFSWLQKIIAYMWNGLHLSSRNESGLSTKSISLANFKTILREQFMQKRKQEVAESFKCFYYRHFQL